MINLPAHTGGAVLDFLGAMPWEKQVSKPAKSLQREGKNQASIGAPEGYIKGNDCSVVNISFSPKTVDWALQVIASQRGSNNVNKI